MEHKIYKELKEHVKAVRKEIGPKCRKRVHVILKNIDRNLLALYRLVIEDAKTELYNSRFLDAMFNIEIEKARRGQKLAIMILDLDNFKQVNDKYGHKRGDDVIKRASELIKQNLRKSDIAARFGGDEFVMLLPFASSKTALDISKRLRGKIIKDKLLSRYDVTASIGIADFEKGDSKHKVFNKADFALLCAKKQGKNLAISYEDV